jgi:hypothetical protein
MIVFDADVLSELFRGTAKYVARAESVPADQHAIAIVVVEEILRGRLSMIRRAEAGRAVVGIERAYQLLQETVATYSTSMCWRTHPMPSVCIKSGEKERFASGPTTYASPPSAWRIRPS